jgi:hypothetical protein
MTFEQLDRSIDADSDSDDEIAEQAHAYKGKFYHLPTAPCPPFFSHTCTVISEKGKESDVSQSFAGLQINRKNSSPEARPPPPPRLAQPAPVDEDEDDFQSEDENDPFADRNALHTPKVERDEPTW